MVGSIWDRWARDNAAAHQQNVAEILGFLASGAIQPRADRVFARDDFAGAFELFEHNQGLGNTVVCFAEEQN